MPVRTPPPASVLAELPHIDAAATGLEALEGDTDRASPAEACIALGVDGSVGLASGAAAERLERFGPNRLTDPPRRPAWRRFVDQFRGVLVVILAGAAGLAAALGDVKDAAVVSVVLVINGVLGFVQEGRAENAMVALRSMLVTRTRVRRDGAVAEVPADRLVPGDIVLLEAGDRVPSDGRFLTAVSVLVDESSLTGESVPVEKTADAVLGTDLALGDRHNRGFMNTVVVRGRAELLVTHTGMATEMGRVAGLMHEAETESTPLQTQLNRLGKRLAILAGVAVSVVFVTRVAQGEAFVDAMLSAVALAIAAIPEGLPAVVTVTLAVGVHQMALRKAIVKRLGSVETLGSTTVICSDKTGTLTLNEMTVRHVIHAGRTHSATDLVAHRDLEVDSAAIDEMRPAFEGAVLCNDASLDHDTVIGDPTEGSLLVLAARAGIDIEAVRRERPRIGEVPFDSAAKFMATFHRDGTEVVCVVKGAPDVVLARSNFAVGVETVAALNDASRHQWEADNDSLAAQGMRVLAVASRRVTASDALDSAGRVIDPERWTNDLTIEMLVGIVDPPRPEARDAIALCRRAGVGVKMITGDHAATAAAIAAELGIEGRVITGAELDAMTDAQLHADIDAIGVCARVSPEHKVRLVRALKRNGHIVAMTGDGVNDAAALRHADIGVAMGVTGTEVTKKAADMVLADDNFATIVGAVEQGRAIYDNIVKFVRFQLTTNLGAIGTLLGASVLGLPAPLSAIQVLYINIIADGPPAMTLGVDPPAKGTMRRGPHRPGTPILDQPRILRLLGAATVMTIGTLGLFIFARGRWGEPVALTMAFTTFVLFQLANVFNARTEDASVWSRESLTNIKLWVAVGTVAAFQILIVTIGPLQDLFRTTTLTAGQWLLAVLVALAVVVTEEARKALDRKRSRARERDEPLHTTHITAPEPGT